VAAKWHNRLRKARESKGLSQRALAEKIGAYQTKYQNWEAGMNEPSYDDLVKLCKVLGVSVDYMLRGRASKLPEDVFFREDALISAVEGVEEYLAKKRKRLKPKTKAQLIWTIYEDLLTNEIESGEIEREVTKLLRMAS
jgi:transcriptional regulator with XRE-family HTH domain